MPADTLEHEPAPPQCDYDWDRDRIEAAQRVPKCARVDDQHERDQRADRDRDRQQAPRQLAQTAPYGRTGGRNSDAPDFSMRASYPWKRASHLSCVEVTVQPSFFPCPLFCLKYASWCRGRYFVM